jgi:hypothetical protein
MLVHGGDLLGFLLEQSTLSQKLLVVVMFVGIAGDVVEGFIFDPAGVEAGRRLGLPPQSLGIGPRAC